VNHWMTINEPWTYGSAVGIAEAAIYSSRQCNKAQPESCKFDSATYPYLSGHYQLLAHAAAVDVYRQKYQV